MEKPFNTLQLQTEKQDSFLLPAPVHQCEVAGFA